MSQPSTSGVLGETGDGDELELECRIGHVVVLGALLLLSVDERAGPGRFPWPIGRGLHLGPLEELYDPGHLEQPGGRRAG